MKILSPVAAREAVHLLILKEFATLYDGDAVVLKGGVNLRAFLASGLADKTLDGALDRVFTITFDEYEGRVLEFLDDDARRRCGTEDAWADFQLQVATLIEAVLARQGDT